MIVLFGPLGDPTGHRMSPLAARVAGCGSVTMAPHGAWPSLVNDARREMKRGRRVKVAGYSIGGNAAREFAAALSPRPVTLVTIDPNAAVGAKPINASATNIRQTQHFLGRGYPAGARDHVVQISHFEFMQDERAMRLAAAALCK